MKKAFIFIATAISSLFFVSCYKDRDMDPGTVELLIGKWMETDIDGQPALTSQKTVTTFVSSTHAFISSSKTDYTEQAAKWNDRLDYEVKMTGNTVILTGHPEPSVTLVNRYTIYSINSKEMVCKFRHQTLKDGKLVNEESHGNVHLAKVTEDYGSAIVGSWEGLYPLDEFDEPQDCRWDLKADDTYVFSISTAPGRWTTYEDEFDQYFVDGKLFCSRWKEVGPEAQEGRAWWEIAALDKENLILTALRRNEDGSTYTEAVSLRKVRVPSQQEIEKNILGKWMQTEVNRKTALTNQKTVTTFRSTSLALVSSSKPDFSETAAKWGHLREYDVKIEGNKVTLTGQSSAEITLIDEYIINRIDEEEMDCEFRHTTIRGELIVSTGDWTPMRLVKQTSDFREAIVGTWEAHVSLQGYDISQGSTELRDCRWQINEDGTFVFSVGTGPEELIIEDEFDEYFMVGTLLCFRWKSKEEGSEEVRDWWEVSIKGDVMNWYALRENEDGSRYFYTISLVRKL